MRVRLRARRLDGGCVVTGASLPELLDRKRLGEELGIGRAVVEAIFRNAPVVEIPGVRKVYVRRPDVERLLANEWLFNKNRVR